jgi:DNA-binding CsgD family transcriptional regulator
LRLFYKVNLPVPSYLLSSIDEISLIHAASNHEVYSVTDKPTAEQISNLIGRIYAASLDKDLWPSFLTQLASAFGSDQGLLLNVDSLPTPGGIVSTIGMDMDVVHRWEPSKEHVDPWFQAAQHITRDTSYHGGDLCSKFTLQKSAFYADSLIPLNIAYTLGGVSVESPARSWVFSVFSSKRHGCFSDEQKALYALLIPHIGRAMKISRQLQQSAATQMALGSALDRSPFGVVILDIMRRVLWMNRKADKILIDCDGITIRYGILRLWDYGAQQVLTETITHALLPDSQNGFDNCGACTAPRASRLQPYHILAYPLTGSTNASIPVEGAACMILIHDPLEPKIISAAILQRLYNFSPAEARLCVALFDNGSLAEVLDRLAISRNTAKTHLKRIFVKAGVSSQVELLHKLATGFYE